MGQDLVASLPPALLERSGDLLAVLTLDGVLHELNPSFALVLQQFGRVVTGGPGVAGRPLEAFVPPEDRPVVREAFAKLRGGAAHVALEVRLGAPARGERWVEWTLTPHQAGRSCFAIGRDITRWKRAEAVAASHGRMLAGIAADAPLAQVFGALAEALERQLPGLLAVVMVPEEGRTTLQVAAAPSLPLPVREALQGVAIAPDGPAPAAAAATGRTVLVPDLLADAAWQRWRPLLVEHRLRAAWSTPVVTAAGDVIATLDCYARAAFRPTDGQQRLVEDAAGLALLAVERRRGDERRRLLTRALGQVNDLVIISEGVPTALPGRRILFVNEAAERLTGYPKEELVGRTLRLLQGEATDRDTLARIGTALDRGEAVREDLLNYRRDGTAFWLEVDIVPLHEGSGAPTHWVTIGRDITERKVAEAERRQHEARLQEMQRLESLTRLAGGIAHDFNNLLAAVLGNTGLALLELPPGSPAVELLRQVEQSTLRAAGLVRQLLAYAGSAPSDLVELDAGRVARETRELLQSLLPPRAALTLDVAEALPLVRADGAQLRQVLVALVGNAADALGEGRGHVTVRVHAAQRSAEELAGAQPPGLLVPGAYVLVEVTDDGAGMDAATQARIFEPFFSTRFVGRGLGLAAALGIARAHGAGLQVESAPGAGTTVRVLLPALERRAEPAPAPRPEAPGARAPSPAAPLLAAGPPAPPGARTVLVVDDEPAVRSIAERLLHRFGYETLAAADGLEALALLDHAAPRVTAILLDVTMPTISGVETLSEIRRRAIGVPVLLSSGHDGGAVRRELATGLGPVSFVQKPYTPVELLRALTEALEHPAA